LYCIQCTHFILLNPHVDAVPLKIDGGPTEGEGRVLIYDDLREAWGAICGAQWEKSAADVACRQLGYASGASEGEFGNNWARTT